MNPIFCKKRKTINLKHTQRRHLIDINGHTSETIRILFNI